MTKRQKYVIKWEKGCKSLKGWGIKMKMLSKLYSKNEKYLRYRKCDINQNSILLEAGQGKNINGNMFALLREININPEWKLKLI